MLASWMAHEGSHCMRDHMKYRILEIRKEMNSGTNSGMNSGMNQQQFMQAYMGAKISRDLEKDADLCAVVWLQNAGFGIKGFVTWLQFAEKLEAISGAENPYLRTHPNHRIELNISKKRRET